MNASAEPSLESSASPASRRRAAALDRIHASALGLILRDGLAAFSLHRLAAELDLTTAALYRYFPSKDALLAEVVGRVIAELAADLRAVAARDAQADPLDRLRALVAHWVERSRLDPHRFGLIQQLLGTPERVFAEQVHARAAIDAMFDALAPVTAVLAEAASRGQLAPGSAEQRALVVFAATEGLLLFRKQAARAPGRLADPEPLVLDTVETLLRGWGPLAASPSPRLSRPRSAR